MKRGASLRVGSASSVSTGVGAEQLSRSVESAVEEAELSGALLLAARALRDFPSAVAAHFDLSDTLVAGQPRNCFRS